MRLVLVAAMAGFLVMAIPEVFGARGSTYLFVIALHLEPFSCFL